MTLKEYMDRNQIEPEVMAARLGVSVSGLMKWVREQRIPRPDMMHAIAEATNGAVTPNDFIGVGERGRGR